MKVVKGGITAAKGFQASGIHCGIKYKNKDLALIYSDAQALACGLFTQNKVQAAPVKVASAHLLKNSRAQAIIVNSGNANCCTGRGGIKDAYKICQATAKVLGISPRDVLIASTGIIGKRLPLEKIIKRIKLLVNELSNRGSLSCAQAIMTTDTLPKQVSVEIKIGGSFVRIGGIAKGAGMIHPHLATMLAFITTDAVIDRKRLNKALQNAAENSFNSITVEGDTSTNDMVLALANGLANNRVMTAGDFATFQKALNFVCLALAKMIIKDAEGATKFVEIQVVAAGDFAQAKRIAFKVANSALVKTAIFGENPNWGRVAACVGIADSAIKEEKLSIYLGNVLVLQNGAAVKVNRHKLNRIFKKDEVKIKISLGLGRCATCVYTCDLSDRYVKINAGYW